MSRCLVTGAAGFIGFHLARRLLDAGHTVVGIDNLNDYYSVQLKRDRLARLTPHAQFTFLQLDLADRAGMERLFAADKFDIVYHLGAQAGVRHSLEHPHVYIDSNLVGTLHVLEGCRQTAVGHLVYASSSSVYGANQRQPFRESDECGHPLSLYAATKRANELMAHSYSHLYQLPTTGLRFFTVYGPWGRPDMALFRFTAAMLAGQPIPVYGHGQLARDFTYVDDIVESIVRIGGQPARGDNTWSAWAPDPSRSAAPFRIYNIGAQQPVPLLDFIATLERCLGVKAQLNLLPLQAGDVTSTAADTSALERDCGFAPRVSVADGIARFVAWYREYYQA